MDEKPLGKCCSCIITVSVSDATLCMLYGWYLIALRCVGDFCDLQAIQESSAVTVSFLKLVRDNLLVLLLLQHRGAKDRVEPQAAAFLVQMRVLSLRPA